MLAVRDVRKKLVREPKARNLLSDLRSLVLDQRDSFPAIAPGEFLDLGQRKSRLLTDLDHPGLTDGLLVVGAMAGRQPAWPQQAEVLPVAQDVCGDTERCRRVADALTGVGHDFSLYFRST